MITCQQTRALLEQESDTGAVHHVSADVLGLARLGPYWRISLFAPAIAESHSPGQFVSVAVGNGLETPLRRCFSVLDADPATGVIEFAFAVHSQGTKWLTLRQPTDSIDVVGPLGRGFPPPPTNARCLLIGGGHGATALYRLARERNGHGDSINVILGAATRHLLFGVDLFTGVSDSVWITTDDGSEGRLGTVCTPLSEIIESLEPTIIYAAGPMAMLQSVAEQAIAMNLPTYVATEAAMACAIGVCMTCVLPVIHDDGITRMTRTCVEGPVFRADQIRWSDLGTIPADCWGA